MLLRADVDVYSAAVVGYRAFVPQLPYYLLYVGDVFVAAYGRYDFAAVGIPCVCAVFLFRVYARIAHRFPSASLSVGSFVSVV